MSQLYDKNDKFLPSSPGGSCGGGVVVFDGGSRVCRQPFVDHGTAAFSHQVVLCTCWSQLLREIRKVRGGVFNFFPPPLQFKMKTMKISKTGALLNEEFEGTAALVGKLNRDWTS